MEDYTLPLQIFSRQLQLTLSDFQILTPLVTSQQISLSFHSPSQEQVSVINSILYYIISVVHKVPLQQYQRTIQKAISSFYIKNKMKIKIYQYSKFCSNLLSINVYECVHVVHYLVYGCFASASYVNMVVDLRQDVVVDKKEKDKPRMEKKSNVIESEKEIFLRDLEDTLKAHTLDEKQDRTEQQNFNKRIVHNPYEIKLPNVDGRQTSPLMNILRKRQIQSGSTIRISRKIKHKDNTKLINSLFSHSVKDKNSFILTQKKTFQNKRVNLKTLLDLKQKIKSENKFLDELRMTLTSSDSNFHKFRSKEAYEPVLQKIDLEIYKKFQKPAVQVEKPIVSYPPTISIPEKAQEPIMTIVDSENNENDNFNYQYMSATHKTPFRSKLNFYKREYKDFLKTRSKQFSSMN